jgi:SAM-dependent methyltransferase
MNNRKDTRSVKDRNVAFYNGVSNEYDQIMEREVSNRVIREKVAEKFRAMVRTGRVLDFGGGTGLDMQWLADSGYTVIFCEPSAGMRDKAIQFKERFLPDRPVLFLDDIRADFEGWKEHLPFTRPVDAILSNFAAINCIPDLRRLFENLSLVLRPGGELIALILDESRSGGLRRHFLHRVRSVLFGRGIDLAVRYKNFHQAVYIHREGTVRKASSEWFDVRSFESLPEYGFNLIHLTRK